MPCYLGLYRHLAPFSADVVVQTLSIIARRLPGFFPAEFPVARKRSVRLSSPTDFNPSFVPGAFVIKPDVRLYVPFDGQDGTVVEITDDRAPTVMPASILVTFASPLPPLDCLEDLMSDLIGAFQPDEARLADDETQLEDDVRDRRFHIDNSKVPDMFYWMTWLNPGLLEAAGPDAVARLAALCHVRRVVGGAIVRLQDEPSAPGEAWTRRRQAAEDAFGLVALHRRFPRFVE